MPREKSSGVIIFSGAGAKRKFLLLHYAAGHWSLPKGHVEPDEDEKETALRELNEETGITESEIVFVEGFRQEIQYYFTKSGELVQKQVVFALARAKTRGGKPPKVRLSFEHTDFAWLPYAEAVEKVTFMSDKSVLAAAQDFLEKGKNGTQKTLFDKTKQKPSGKKGATTKKSKTG